MKKILFFLVMMPAVLFGQDARFSQYFNNPLLLNPALTGNGIEHIRVTAIYRNQWAGLGTPYTTQGFAVDKKVGRVGLGGYITRNGAGDAGIKTLSVAGNISYNLEIGSEKINVVSAGLQVGINNKSFDESKMKFDNQYNPDGGYDPTINSGEIFTSTSVTRPDVNIGLMWQRGWNHKDIKFKPFAGLALSHVNRPSETFIVDQNKTAIKQTIYAGAGYQLSEKTEVRPTLMMLRQEKFQETTFGALINHKLDNKNSVQIGVYDRFNDAIIAYAGYQMNLLFVGMSYDVNTSDLRSTGKGNNAFEISLTYSPRPKRIKQPEEKEFDKKADALAYAPMLDFNYQSIAIPDVLEGIAVNENTIAKERFAVTSEPATATAPVEQKTTPAETIVAAVPPAEIKNDFDKDGIADNDDDCPYIKGVPGSKGCPDSDGDGVIDLVDDCPMESGSIAKNGCPEPDAPVAEKTQTLVKKFDNILFASGLSKLRTDDIYDIIERAIDIMYADKNSTVILSGHTDSEGNEFSNMMLSESRIEVVRKYMIRQGIDPLRITTVAYGETMPLENNRSSEGKQLNRRVEINILKNR